MHLKLTGSCFQFSSFSFAVSLPSLTLSLSLVMIITDLRKYYLMKSEVVWLQYYKLEIKLVGNFIIYISLDSIINTCFV